MKATLLAAFMAMMIPPCLSLFVQTVSADHSQAYSRANTDPRMFQNSTQIAGTPGYFFRGTVKDQNGSVMPPLSPAEWLLVAAIVAVVSASLLAVRKKSPTDMHLERS